MSCRRCTLDRKHTKSDTFLSQLAHPLLWKVHTLSLGSASPRDLDNIFDSVFLAAAPLNQSWVKCSVSEIAIVLFGSPFENLSQDGRAYLFQKKRKAAEKQRRAFTTTTTIMALTITYDPFLFSDPDKCEEVVVEYLFRDFLAQGKTFNLATTMKTLLCSRPQLRPQSSSLRLFLEIREFDESFLPPFSEGHFGKFPQASIDEQEELMRRRRRRHHGDLLQHCSSRTTTPFAF